MQGVEIVRGDSGKVGVVNREPSDKGNASATETAKGTVVRVTEVSQCRTVAALSQKTPLFATEDNQATQKHESPSV